MILSKDLKDHLLENGWQLSRCALLLDAGYQPDESNPSLPAALEDVKPEHCRKHKEYSLLYYEEDINNDGDVDVLEHALIDEVFYSELDVIIQSPYWKDKEYSMSDGLREWRWLDD